MFRRSALADMLRHPLVSTIVLAILMIIFYAVNIPTCGTSFLIAALIFGTIWLVRFTRDQRTATEARARMQQQAAPPLNTPGATPTQATPYMMQPPTQRAKRSGRVYLPGQQDNDPQ